MLNADAALTGTLHAFVAFDWGDEVDLVQAGRLVPAEIEALARRRRTPSSIDYRPPPLRYLRAPVPLQLPEIGAVQAEVEATLFDFGAVSVALKVPFALTPPQLSLLASWLADPAALVQSACASLSPLHSQLKAAILRPDWRTEFSEEYLVFEFLPCPALSPDKLLSDHAAWLAGLLLLESATLSVDEVADALRLRVSYTPDDLFLSDWAASVLIDRSCEETLQVIELSNVQLLEYRYLDNRLDDILAQTNRRIQRRTQSWRLPWTGYRGPLRSLGLLKMDTNELFERTGNVLKLYGDQYLVQAYRQMAARFHLPEWEQSIRGKLEMIEGIYTTLADQAHTARAELLELTVVLLIVLEIILAFVH